jgi:TonB family protein
MKIKLVSLFLFLNFPTVWAQEDFKIYKHNDGTLDTIFYNNSQEASFEKGTKNLLDTLLSKMTFPEDGFYKDFSGFAICFLIGKNGDAIGMDIHGFGSYYDFLQESSGKIQDFIDDKKNTWISAKKNGKNVNSCYYVDLIFSPDTIQAVTNPKDTIKLVDFISGLSVKKISNFDAPYQGWNDKEVDIPSFDPYYLKWLTSQIIYPKLAKDKKITGTVIIRVIIDEKGNLLSKEIISPNSHKLLNDEVLRVINKIKSHNPAIHKNKKVRVYAELPFDFKLTK